MATFPVLLSIPHSGEEIPPEVKDRIILSRADVFEDIDPYTREIYDLGDKVAQVVSTDIARTFVDLNRGPHDLPPINPDGVIKSQTCYGKGIYQKGSEPDELLTKHMLKKHYFPYHQEIQKILDNKSLSIDLALDCHSMASVAPLISPDKGEERPMVCLGNFYGHSCSQEMIEEMAFCFCKAFNLKDADVSINNPFAGGYITQLYGGHPLPWIQIEINRTLYLSPPYFNQLNHLIDEGRLTELRQNFAEALSLFI
jgi:formiminoglutamase